MLASGTENLSYGSACHEGNKVTIKEEKALRVSSFVLFPTCVDCYALFSQSCLFVYPHSRFLLNLVRWSALKATGEFQFGLIGPVTVLLLYDNPW